MLPHGYGGDRPLPEGPDLFRPAFHFTPPHGWMNDPNGLIWFAGEYHLFYQHRWPRHWGHAISRDLVHWDDLEIALEPDDVGHIWSGCVVADENNTSGLFQRGGLVAIFTHWDHGPQHQSLAWSEDNGRTWHKHKSNPVLPNPGIEDFRDPKVIWHGPSNRWIMAVAAGDHLRFLLSPNLLEWKACGEWSHPALTECGIYECPDLFELPIQGTNETRWVLQISIGGPRVWRGFYLVGHFDGETFHAESGLLPSDYGRDAFAHTSCETPNGERVWMAWMNNWAYASRTPTTPWQGAMTVPRVLQLAQTPQGLVLTQQPVSALRMLRGAAILQQNLIVENSSMPLEVRGFQLEIRVLIRLQTATAVGVRVAVGEQQRCEIRYTPATKTLVVDRTHTGQRHFAQEFDEVAEAFLTIADNLLLLHVLVDRCSVEVFAQEGQVAITSLMFPEATGNGVELFAQNGVAVFECVEVYQLAAAHTRGT